MTPNARFWDKLAPRYARLAISDPEGYQETLARTRAHLGSTDHVLELGCGTASTALELAPDVAHITASDFSPAMITIGAKKLLQSGYENVTLKVADSDDPALAADAPYDAVLAFNLLHLVADQVVTLNKMHDILRPGGLLISKTACLRAKWYLGPMLRALQLIGKAPHVLLHSEAELRQRHADAGFEIVEELVQSGPVPRLFIVARRR